MSVCAKISSIVLLFLTVGFLPPALPHVTVHMIGDSTMADKPLEDNPERGWGQLLKEYFDSTVTVKNYAKNGRSTRSFLRESLWTPVLDAIQPGDYVFIQFGHNDEKPEKVDRFTPPDQYKVNLTKFVTEAREHKGIPVLCTPIMRRKFDDKGNFVDQHGVYPGIVRDLAKELNVPLIDMHRSSEKLIVGMGPDSSKKIFLFIPPGAYKSLPTGREDNTHFSDFGARKMAELAIEGMRSLNLDLVQRLKSSSH